VVRNRRIVVFQRSAVRDFIVIADIKCRNAVHRFLDAVSIAVIRVGRRRSANGDAGETIFLVIYESITIRASRTCRIAARHVAVLVITEIIRAGLRDRVLVRGIVIQIGHIPVVVVARLAKRIRVCLCGLCSYYI